MAVPILDFGHLTPDERIELAGQLWDSLEPDAVGPDEELTAELRWLGRRARVRRRSRPAPRRDDPAAGP